MPRKLKVYRTPIGFHDAYVAAPSRKAALEAWGTDRNLFARGAAEEVTEAALMREPLAHPGEIVRVRRGSDAEHLAAAVSVPAARKKKAAVSKRGRFDASKGAGQSHRPTPPLPRRKPKPRPARDGVDKADAALAQAVADRDAKLEDFRERADALVKERRRFEQQADRQIAKLEAVRDRASATYQRRLEAWRSSRAD